MRSKNYTILLTEIITIILMVFNVLPREAAWVLTGILIFYFIFSPLEDSLWVFIASIPLFVALPLTENFDSMSNWRVLLTIMFLVLAVQIIIARPKALMALFNDRIVVLLFIFSLIGFLSLFAASDVWAGVKKLLFLINIFLLFIIIRNLAFKNKDIINKITSAVWVALGLSLVVGYVQFISVFFTPLYTFWQFWSKNVIPVFYGQKLGQLLSYSNTWFSYYDSQPPTLRMFSVFPDSHSLALFLVIGLPILLTLILKRPKENKKLLFVLYPVLIIMLLPLIFSGSRGIWVSAFALLILLFIFILIFKRASEMKTGFHFRASAENTGFESFIFRPSKTIEKSFGRSNKTKGFFAAFFQVFQIKIWEPKKIIWGQPLSKGLSLIIGSLIIFFLLFPISSWFLLLSQKAQLEGLAESEDLFLVFERAKSISDLTEISAKSRLEIWQRTVDSIARHPVLGVGPGNFPVILGEDVSAAKRGASAHNLYLDVAAEMGIFALLIFLVIFWEILKTAWQVFQKGQVWAGFFGLVFIWILIYSLFDIVLLNDKVLLFFTVNLALLYASKSAVGFGQSPDL